MPLISFAILLASIVLGGLAMNVPAQEPPLPAHAESPQPTASPSPSRPQLNIPDIPIAVEPPTLVPDKTNSTPTRKPDSPASRSSVPLSQLDAAFQQSPLGQAREEQRLHLEWRQLQNRAAQDPSVIAAKIATTNVKTDLEKRDRLRNYYNIYYAKMQGLTSSPQMKGYLEGKKAAALGSLAQPRVRPDPTPRKKSIR